MYSVTPRIVASWFPSVSLRAYWYAAVLRLEDERVASDFQIAVVNLPANEQRLECEIR
jgi:hypothetical protein